ncbi:MAG: exosortase/archaeosortase family protein [Candidatus Aenigmarchaeota archaeon]|nr:exosortase/archaeosortase family protein [Candidatus Aenigmarchaeota archaeon]
MKVKLNKEQQKLLETLIFLVKLTLFSIPVYIILTFHNILFPLQYIVAKNVHMLLNVTGFDMAMEGMLIFGNGVSFFISEDCTGWKSAILLIALIFSVPKIQLRKRVMGVIAGLPVLYVANILRILIVIFVWKGAGRGFADIFHDYLWQVGLVFVVMIIWVLWLMWTGKLRNNAFKKLLH